MRLPGLPSEAGGVGSGGPQELGEGAPVKPEGLGVREASASRIPLPRFFLRLPGFEPGLLAWKASVLPGWTTAAKIILFYSVHDK